MKKMLIYLRDYKKEAILAPLFKMLEALFDLFVPLVVSRMINQGVLEGNSSVLTQGFLTLILLAAVGLVCSFTAQYFSAKASVGFTTKLRQAIFDHIQSMSHENLDSVGTNTLITRLTSDCLQVQNGLNLALRLLMRSPFIVFGAMIMAFTINVRAAIIFVIIIPILIIVVFAIMLASIPMFKKVQQGLDHLLSLTRENLTGVRVIRAFRREQDQISAFDESNDLYTKMNEKVGRLSALMNPVTYVLINIATIILIQSGAVQVNLGNLLQGDVVALYNYMAQIVVELIKLANLLITIDKSIACTERIQSVLDIENTMTYPEHSATRSNEIAIAFDHVSFTYHGSSETALEDITFSIEQGKTLGIIGPTGSGKSTLVQLITRSYDSSPGTVSLFGNDIKEYTKEDIVNVFGVVPQRAVLFKGSVRENMQYGNENASDEQIWNALEKAQAKDVIEQKEGKLDFQIEQAGRNLSGGQKQRLTIARALVKNPEILILDDSSSALDFATDANLRKAIHQLNTTTVMISQRTSTIRNADLILVLEDGKLIGKGTHEELMQSCHSYQETYYSQFPEEKPADFQMEVIA